MRIVTSAVALESQADRLQITTQQSTVRSWVGEAPQTQSPVQAATLTLSNEARNRALSNVAIESTSRSRADLVQALKNQGITPTSEIPPPLSVEGSPEAEENINDPRLFILAQLVEGLTGKRVRVIKPSDLQKKGEVAAVPSRPQQASTRQSEAPPAQTSEGWGLEIRSETRTVESERVRFEASGVVRTEDGREIAIRTDLSLAQDKVTVSRFELALGDAAQTKDPLILAESPVGVKLTDQKVAFDLNADGTQEAVPVVAGGRVLVQDLNGNGTVDNGRELFGPTTGDGFAELAQLDADQNGWIDAADPAWSQLALWTGTEEGKGEIQSLAAAGVGALYAGSAATPYTMVSNQGVSQGELRATSVWLSEEGAANLLQQVDFKV